MSVDADDLPPGRDASNRTIGVLISGRGSNLQALIDAVADGQLNARIAIVISNRARAAGLSRAAGAGIETLVIDHRSFPSRDEFDRAVAQELLSRGVRLVCLAGFMPLLPAFPGVEAQRQALDHGVRITGATVHLVSSELDAGPIVLQASVPVRPDDTPETLSARILVEEHRLYPAAVQLILDGQWSVSGRRLTLYQTPGTSL
jgi:phosphoribosylglycinamide formyltransferase-1